MANESSTVIRLREVMSYIRGLPPHRKLDAIDEAMAGLRDMARDLLELRIQLDPNTSITKYTSRSLVARKKPCQDSLRSDNIFSVNMAGASLTPFERIEAIGYTISDQGPTRIGALADQLKDTIANIYRALNAIGYRKYFCKCPQGVALTSLGERRFKIRKGGNDPRVPRVGCPIRSVPVSGETTGTTPAEA